MDTLLTLVFLGFPGGSVGKESAYNSGGLGLIPELGWCPGEGNSYPLHYSALENSMDCIVHRVTKSQTWVIDFNFHLSVSWEICMQVKKQQLELDMEQQTGSKLGKKYVKAVYCHLVYLTYIQSTSYEMPAWMNHELESRLPREISTTSDTQMIPP